MKLSNFTTIVFMFFSIICIYRVETLNVVIIIKKTKTMPNRQPRFIRGTSKYSRGNCLVDDIS